MSKLIPVGILFGCWSIAVGVSLAFWWYLLDFIVYLKGWDV